LRTFIAIVPPSNIKMSVDEIVTFLQKQTPHHALKWVETDNCHLTLKFIGSISENQVIQVKNTLTEVLSNHRAFKFTIEGLGVFPHKEEPRVVWLGITDKEALISLHQKLDHALQAKNIPPDQRAYNPHLTIARIRKNVDRETARQIGDILSQYKVDTIGKINVTKVVLYQSQLTPTGPIYTPLQVVPLSKV